MFLLSIDEACGYFGVGTWAQTGKGSADLLCEPTGHAVAMGAFAATADELQKDASDYPWLKEAESGSCYWWLRSPGCDPSFAARVFVGGFVNSIGASVDTPDNAVRPAIWVAGV